MSFWNNPENNSIKIVLLIIIVAIAGYFVYKNMQTNGGDQGRVIRTSPSGISTTPGPRPAAAECVHANEFIYDGTDCNFIDNTDGACVAKKVHGGECTGKEKIPAATTKNVAPSTTSGTVNTSTSGSAVTQ